MKRLAKPALSDKGVFLTPVGFFKVEHYTTGRFTPLDSVLESGLTNVGNAKGSKS